MHITRLPTNSYLVGLDQLKIKYVAKDVKEIENMASLLKIRSFSYSFLLYFPNLCTLTRLNVTAFSKTLEAHII